MSVMHLTPGDLTAEQLSEEARTHLVGCPECRRDAAAVTILRARLGRRRRLQRGTRVAALAGLVLVAVLQVAPANRAGTGAGLVPVARVPESAEAAALRLVDSAGGALTQIEATELVRLASFRRMMLEGDTSDHSDTLRGVRALAAGDAAAAARILRGRREAPALSVIARHVAGEDVLAELVKLAGEVDPAASGTAAALIWFAAKATLRNGDTAGARSLLIRIAGLPGGGFAALAADLLEQLPE